MPTIKCTVTVIEPGQPHRLDTLAGDNAARLFEGFEESRNYGDSELR
jgi:hypothetical protein